MLAELRVRDLAVLEDVEVSFGTGLTVLTGETGAGKSLVVDALSLLSGERADAALVRAGAEKLVVEGLFETDDREVRGALEEAGLLEGEKGGRLELVIRREIAATGRGRLFINGSPAALRTLLLLSPRLLVLYGQAEARELLDPDAARELLDRFAGLAERGAETGARFAAWKLAEAEKARVAGAAATASQRLAALEDELRQIDAVRPRAGEDEELAAEKAVLSNVEKVGRSLSEALAALEGEDGGALQALAAARKGFTALAGVDPAAEASVREAAELFERASSLAAETSRRLARLEADPGRLAAVAERLDALARLKRKHGPSLAEVLAHREAAGRELDELSDLSGALRKAEAASQAAFGAFRESALALAAERAAAAPLLGRAVERHLRDLAFAKASFAVVCEHEAEAGSAFEVPAGRQGAQAGGIAFGPRGIDQVGFLFAPNPGEPARPLAKIASGGELSRVQLALGAALAERDAEGGRRREKRAEPVRTFVFDEVDAGVSGATAEAVGAKLHALAAGGQVIVVTHLAQVAAAGDEHLDVTKVVAKGRTRTAVERLSEDGRVDAIAALLAGAKITDAARQQARALLSSRESRRKPR